MSEPDPAPSYEESNTKSSFADQTDRQNFYSSGATKASDDLAKTALNHSISLEGLVEKLSDQKSAFLEDIHEKVLQQVSHTSRTDLVSIIEKDGYSVGQDRIHYPGFDSYVKVFTCFVAKKSFHNHSLDSAISEPVAKTVSESYATFMSERQVEIAEFLMKKIVEDEVLRTAILGYAATELLKNGVKKGRSHIVSVLSQALVAHAAHSHVGLAIQHGVLVATAHVTGVVGGTTAAVGGALLATLILKAVAAHMGLTMGELLHTQALHGLVIILSKKIALAAAAGVAVSFLSTHIGAAGAATLAHALVAPVAVGIVAVTLYKLPNSLGKRVAKGVRDELSGEFESMTSQVLDELFKDILSVEALGKAIANEIVGMENWQSLFEGGLDTSADPSLNSDMATDIKGMDDIRRGLFGGNEKSQSSNIAACEAPCPICNTDMHGVSDAARNEHILKCAESNSTGDTRSEKAPRYQKPTDFRPVPPPRRLVTVIALYNFDSGQPGDLLFEKGEIITVIKRTESEVDWWTGRIGNRTGIFPSNFTKPT